MKKVKAIFLSVGVMTVVSALLLMLISVILAKTASLPKGSLPILVTGVGCISILAGAFLASVYIKEKGIIFGLISGVIYLCAALLVATLVLQGEFTPAGIGKGAAFLISGALGGIMGVNRKSKVRF